MYSEDDFRTGLENKQFQKEGNSAIENVKAFYSKNEPYIKACYSYYLQYDSKKDNYINQVKYEEVDEFKKELNGRTILILTANPIEEGKLLHSLVDAGKKLNFYLLNTVSNIFKPDAIMLLGICYGINFNDFDVGNVLISANLKTWSREPQQR